MNIFTQRLKELRKNKGDIQTVIANYLGIRQNAYQRYESGEREPNFEKLIKIADYFDVSVDYLLGRTNKIEINK